MWRVPTWLTEWLKFLRDVLATGAGLWGVVREELSNQADLGRLAFFAVLMIAPGTLAGYWELTQRNRGTGEESSGPPSPASPSPPGSPSPAPSRSPSPGSSG